MNGVDGDLDVAGGGVRLRPQMKAYDELLNEDLQFRAPVLDVQEFLADRGLSNSFASQLQPCQRPWPCTSPPHDSWPEYPDPTGALLRAIPYPTWEAIEAGVCCAASALNLVQPDEAAELGRIKADDLSSTGAGVVASANIGCTLQLRRHLGDRAEVLHPMQLLAASAGIHPLPGVAQGVGTAEVSGKGEDRQASVAPL